MLVPRCLGSREAKYLGRYYLDSAQALKPLAGSSSPSICLAVRTVVLEKEPTVYSLCPMPT